MSEVKKSRNILLPIMVISCLGVFGAYLVLMSMAFSATHSGGTGSLDAGETEIPELEIIDAPELHNQGSFETYTEINNGEIHYYSSGSSSCPPRIEKAEYINGDTIQLVPYDYTGNMCTMDMAPVAERILRVDEKEISDDTEVVINYKNSSGEEEINFEDIELDPRRMHVETGSSPFGNISTPNND